MPPRVAVRDIAFFERPVRFTRPFRFGAVVVNAASQAFVRVEIEVEGKGSYLAAHPDLYIGDGNGVRLSIHDGDLLTGSLTSPGFATGVHPDWPALSPLEHPKAKNLQEQSI